MFLKCFEDFSIKNVPKTFLNIIVSIRCAFVAFHSHKPTGRINTLSLNQPLLWPAKRATK